MVRLSQGADESGPVDAKHYMYLPGEIIDSDFPRTTSGIGVHLLHLEKTHSTNKIAKTWVTRVIAAGGGLDTLDPDGVGPPNDARSRRGPGFGDDTGFPDGVVVLANTQTQGRGRQGRAWESSPGQNLLLSVILKAKEPLVSNHVARGMLPLATALAVADTIQAHCTSETILIKWPNDILVDGLKCAGILVETVADEAFIVGIGVNVNETQFSDELAETATSLWLSAGQRVERKAVYSTLLDRLNHWIPFVFRNEIEAIRSQYVERLAGVGQAISLNTGSGVVTGTMAGIHEDGGLILEYSSSGDSLEHIYYAGDVSLRHPLV